MYIQHNFNHRAGVSLPNSLLAFYYSRTSSFCVYPAGVVSSSRLALVYLIMLLGRFKECIISEYCRTPCARSVCRFCSDGCSFISFLSVDDYSDTIQVTRQPIAIQAASDLEVYTRVLENLVQEKRQVML